MSKVLILSGPTATGKTSIGVEIAKLSNAHVVNFDSLLLYREITIGTAKPTVSEMENVPHHMIGISSISHSLNAADYSKMARPLIEDLLKKNINIVLSGGSGFYLQALVKGMYDSKTTPPEILAKSLELYKAQGIEPFRKILLEHDKSSYDRYHENDHYRIRRAVEHFWTTGLAMSSARDEMQEESAASRAVNWNIEHFYLDIPKHEHQNIIEKRTKKMLHDGLLEEVRNLLNSGFTGLEKPLQSIGYKEALQFLHGEFKGQDEFIERIIISTRQLAKSQRTWFKKIQKIEFNSLLEKDKILLQSQNFFKGSV